MKQLICKALISGLLLVLLFCGSGMAETGIAIVKNIEGTVTVKRSEDTFPVKQGDRLQNGDIIITGSQSRIGVIFQDGSILSMEENSFLRIKDFIFQPIEKKFKFNLFLEKGTTMFESGKIGKLSPGSFNFEIPDGTIGIRGTKFLVEVK